MKRFILFLVAVATSGLSFGITTWTVPGTYITVSAAVTALNSGVPAGGVNIDIAAGYTENITSALTITATGTSSNPIVFEKSGSGTNPKITRTDAGSLSTSTLGGDGDAIFKLSGTDYITFNGIDITAQSSGIEYGYYTFKPTATNGCQHVTIRNSTVTMTKGTSGYVSGIYISNGPTAVYSSTGVTVTATSGENAYITLTSNTILNVHAGVMVIGSSSAGYYDTDVSVGTSGYGNTIQNFGGGNASTTYGVYFLNVNNPSVVGNIINNAAGGGSPHGSNLYGIFYSVVTGTLVGSGNTITMADNYTSGNTYWISNNSTVASETFDGNTFAGGTLSTGSMYLINANNNTPNETITNNVTSGTITRTGSSGYFYCFYNNSSGATGGTATIQNNNFSNISQLSSTQGFYGIYHQTSSSQSCNCSSNTLSNITQGTGDSYLIYSYSTSPNNVYNNTVSSITQTGGVSYGIVAGGGTVNVYGNNVNGISSGGSVLCGLHLSGAIVNAYKNKSCNLSVTGASASVYGVYDYMSSTLYLYNNFISDLKAPAVSSGLAIAGIYLYSYSTTVGLYYNTVYLAASSTGTSFGTAAVYASTAPNVDMRDNILVNVSTPAGTGVTSVYRRSTASLTTYASTSNNNCFWGGATQDATHAVYYDGISAYNMSAFQALVSMRDNLSFRELPPFNGTTPPCPDLHLQTTIGTRCESGGTPVSSPVAITDDYDGNARNATTPDVGADEFAGTLPDLTPPAITYTPLVNTLSTASRSLAVTITDASGVSASPNDPVLYWNVNSGAYSFVHGSLAGSVYTFTFGGGSVGDVIHYYVVAQDNSSSNNVGSGPSGATCTNNPPRSSSPPAAPSLYKIVSCISGTKTVGASGCDYPTLTAAVADLNAKILCGPLVFVLKDASYSAGEVFPIIIYSNLGSSSVNTVTIHPDAGVTSSVTGSQVSGAMITVLNSYTTIDGSNSGGSTRNLTLINNSTTASTLCFGSPGPTPLIGFSLKNCVILNGTSNSSAIIGGDGTASGAQGYFNNFTIQNNDIKKAYIGIYTTAISSSGNGSGLITQNSLNSTGSDQIRFLGIYCYNLDGVTVSKNDIGNFNGSDDENDAGIWLAYGTVNSIVEKNIVHDIGYTGTSGYGAYGICVSSGITNCNDVVKNNFISHITGDGNNYLNGAQFEPIGIYASSTQTGVSIFANSINLYGATLNHAGAASMGIALGTGSVADIRDNIISNCLGLLGSIGYGAIGIYAQSSNTQFTDLNYNDYYINPLIGYPAWGAIASGGTSTWATWVANTGGRETNGVTGNPSYTSNSDLHIIPTAVSPVSNAGTHISSVTDDIDGDTRSLTTPDIGADEYTFTVADPTGCSAVAMDLTHINVNFTLNANGNYVAIAWNTSGTFSAPSGAPPLPGNSFAGGTLLSYGTTSPSLHNCSPHTHYYYKLFSYYPGANLFSSGVPVDATTCLNVISFPFTESFDGTTFPPDCWSIVHEGNVTGDWARMTSGLYPLTAPHTGAAMATFQSWTYQSDAISDLITPAIQMPAGSYQVKFWMVRDAGYANDSDRVKVYFNSTPTTTGATLLGTINRYKGFAPVETGSDGWYQYIFTLPTTGANTQYFIFKAESKYGNNIYLDDITIDAPPPCLPPTGCSATTISTTQINVGFTVNEYGDNVAIAWNTTGSFTAPSGAPPSPGDPFAGGTLLSYSTASPVAQTCSPSTHYYYMLYSYNPATNLYSSGVPVDATTCLNVTSFPFTESFDGTTFPPDCWNIVHEGSAPGDWSSSTYGSYGGITPHSGTAMAFFHSYYFNSGAISDLITPAVQMPAGGYQVRFWMVRDDGYSDLQYADEGVSVYCNSSPTTTGATLLGFVPRCMYFAPVETEFGWHQYTFTLPSTGPAIQYFIFSAKSEYGGDIYLDDVTIDAPSLANKTLSLSSVLMEGMYKGWGVMFQAKDMQFDAYGNLIYAGPKWGATTNIADTISIELHCARVQYDACGLGCNVIRYDSLVYSAFGIPLDTLGNATAAIPAKYDTSYYITIRQRNHLATVTALPVDFSGTTITYAFDDLSKAFDGNMTTVIEDDGETVSPPLFFGGDVNQDGQIESDDINAVGNDAADYLMGYLPTDIVPDAMVESDDINIVGNNAALYVFAHTPN